MTTIWFQVEPSGATLKINDGFAKAWYDVAASDRLVSAGGHVDDTRPGKLICHSEGVPVITLQAGWDAEVSDEGPASCDLCTGTPSVQRWRVVKREK